MLSCARTPLLILGRWSVVVAAAEIRITVAQNIVILGTRQLTLVWYSSPSVNSFAMGLDTCHVPMYTACLGGSPQSPTKANQQK